MGKYAWGRGSKRHQKGLHPDIIRVLNRAIDLFDICDATVIDGTRTQKRQDALVLSGASRTRFSRHLVQADGFGHAVDVVPWESGRIPWPDQKRQTHPEYLRRIALFQHVIECMLQAADEVGVLLQSGADWDMDGVRVDDDPDESFLDMPHFELPSPHELDAAKGAANRREKLRDAEEWLELKDAAEDLSKNGGKIL